MAIPGQVTDFTRLESHLVQYPSVGAAIDAYLVQPQAPGRYPGVIVIHEAFGPVEHIHDVAHRLANQGYIALAPNLYSRVGTPSPSNTEEVFSKMFALSDEQVVNDLNNGARFIRSLPHTSGRVGAMGFCSGGRQSLLFASSSREVDAAIDCWGGFIRKATPNDLTTKSRPTPVIDLVDNLHCPLFVVIGEEDHNPSPEDGDALKRRLEQHHKAFQYKVYQEAGHAFFADYRANYREGAAFKLWDDVLEFFGTHLK
jgi:carboxymethylenebutenolidase